MSVIVVTGQPGSGKTALVVDMLAHDEQFEGRPIFVMGIPDLTIEHSPCPPVTEWTELRQAPEDDSVNLAYFTFPENSLVVIDEAQRIYRPRPTGSKVPPEVAAFETHRHLGIDFILLTQHPGLIDANIRKLVGRHIHIRVTALGRYKYEWPELGDPESHSSREIAAREKYKLPKRAFELYKSSQLHTKIKTNIPWFVWMFGIAAISAVGLGLYAYKRISVKMEPAPIEAKEGSPKKASAAPADNGKLSTAEYLVQEIPRVPGLQHTAPKYDELTKPTDAPWPAACVIVGAWNHKSEHCRCTDQQGNAYRTTDALCRHIAINGLFKEWGDRRSDERPQVERPSSGPASTTNPAAIVSEPLAVPGQSPSAT